MEKRTIRERDAYFRPFYERAFVRPGVYMDFVNQYRFELNAKEVLLVEGCLYSHAMTPEEACGDHEFRVLILEDDVRVYHLRISENVYLLVPEDRIILKSVCAHCGKTPNKLWTCSGCLVRKYCSRKCQRKHRAVHREECQTFRDRRGEIVKLKRTRWAHEEWVTMASTKK